MALQTESPAFVGGGEIPVEFTCDGKNVNPPLTISGIPAGASSLVLVVDDIDAPKGVFDHWVVFDLPLVMEIKSGQETGVGGMNSFGEIGYGGPCPPTGKHRYYFRLWALDTKLNLPIGSKRREVEAAMDGHILERAEMMGTYSRTISGS